MMKTYISVLMTVLLVGAQFVRAQESLNDVFAQLDSANEGSSGSAGKAVAAESATAAVPVAEAAAATEVSRQDDLFQKGLDFYKAGEYDKAEAVFEAMLGADKYDGRAMIYLKRTAQRRAASAVKMQSTTRANAIADLDGSWNPQFKAGLPVETGTKVAGKTEEDVLKEQMEARLKGIVIPSLDFRDANIQDVVLFLTESCRRLDPAGKGVNILLLGLDSAKSAEGNITISIRDMNLYNALQYIVEMAGLKFEVEPQVVSIMPVNYVKSQDMILKSYDIVPEIGADLQSISSSGASSDKANDLFGGAAAAAGDTTAIDVHSFFSVVEFPNGASAVYQPRFQKLFVKNTPKNIKMIDDILNNLADEAIKKRSQQVEIEAKFVEFNEGAYDELGFDWTLYDKGEFAGFGLGSLAPANNVYYQSVNGYNSTVANGTIYTDPVSGAQVTGSYNGQVGQNLFGTSQRNGATAYGPIQSGLGILESMGGVPASMTFRQNGNFPLDLTITAMEQEGTADVLSAPKITTKSGNEATIRVVEVHRYPQDYDVETGQRTAPVVKPQDWNDYDLGVVLKVTPVVDAGANTIDLDLQPEIKSFKGYDNYVVGYNSYAASGNNSDASSGNGSSLLVRMPFFETRTVQTQVTVADGSTVVMGGLVNETTETFTDRVPFLGDIPYVGRLFRTEGSRSAKKNLVVYVKATQVDAQGYTRAERAKMRASEASK